MADFGVFAAVVFGYALVSRRLDRMAITAPMVFVAAGILLGPDVLGLVGLELTAGAGLLVAEVALVLVLFTDASRIDLRSLRGQASLPARLLGIGMPLTIALGVATGALLLGDLDFWEAAIVAAVLAPTDAALGQAVLSSPGVPQRMRQSLNVESGLNDGLSVSFLSLFVALAVEESNPGAQEAIGFAAEQIGIGTVVGIVVGAGGGWLVEQASERRWMTDAFSQLSVLALAVVAWALAEQLGGNGFIAAFAGGLALGHATATCGPRILEFVEDEGQLLSGLVFFIFGVGALSYLGAASWEVVLFALLALTAVRMLPVAIATAGAGLRRGSVAFLGWFGPRGLASIILALVVVDEEPGLPGLDLVLAGMTVTVLVSVVAHGLSARPLVRAYGAYIGAPVPRRPEDEPMPDLPTRGFRASP